MKNLLLIGESWITITTHQKGFDHFSTVDYTESADSFKAAMRERGWQVDHLPSHLIGQDFPKTIEALAEYDAIVLSDVGSNSFLLPTAVFIRSETEIDRLALLVEYVKGGGGLVMIGGYMSFAGLEGKARYGRTVLADVLPVKMHDFDDRVETPAGVAPVLRGTSPFDLSGLGTWPELLGYNATVAREDADVLVAVDGDPIIATRQVGEGRSAVFTSDLAPHWVTPEFVDWAGYGEMWEEMMNWVSGYSGESSAD